MVATIQTNIKHIYSVKELQDPNSPMVKNVSEWDNGDLARAFDSPSYDYNTYLQNKVEEYIRTKW